VNKNIINIFVIYPLVIAIVMIMVFLGATNLELKDLFHELLSNNFNLEQARLYDSCMRSEIIKNREYFCQQHLLNEYLELQQNRIDKILIIVKSYFLLVAVSFAALFFQKIIEKRMQHQENN
jgi:hypothetical protein